MAEEEYSILELRKIDLFKLKEVRKILFQCGKYMAQKYGLHHWENSYLKSWIVVFIGVLKNNIYVVEKNNNIIATFQIKKIGEELLFQKLATKPKYMGKGIGSFCIKEIEKIAKKIQCKYIVCEVYDESNRAIKFYKDNGYIICGNKKTLRYNEFKMRKEL